MTPLYASLNDLATAARDHVEQHELDTAEVLALLATGLFHHREAAQGRCGDGFHHSSMTDAIAALERLVGIAAPAFTWPTPASVTATPVGHPSCRAIP